MNPNDFQHSTSGKCVRTAKGYWAFMPNRLPPAISYDAGLIHLLSEADRLLGELSGTGRILPNPYFLIGPYVRREAVSSSRIEGTEASLSDLFFFEAAGLGEAKAPDVREVQSYVRAMERGIGGLRKLPISIRLFREIHSVLMEGVRGEDASPGELRRNQNWIGLQGCSLDDATFVPPPPEAVQKALGDWETYLHSKSKEPALVQCALMHYQFEAIHPFRDGNGRIGRLLITFFLFEGGFLTQPLLYLSDFFDRHRDDYYAKLLGVSQRGDWRGWIEFFLKGVAIQCTDAISDAKKILDLHAEYKRALEGTRRIPDTAHRLVDEIFLNPVVSISGLSKKWNVQFNPVKRGVRRLIDVGILLEVPGRKRNKLFVAPKLMKLLVGADKEEQ